MISGGFARGKFCSDVLQLASRWQWYYCRPSIRSTVNHTQIRNHSGKTIITIVLGEFCLILVLTHHLQLPSTVIASKCDNFVPFLNGSTPMSSAEKVKVAYNNRIQLAMVLTEWNLSTCSWPEYYHPVLFHLTKIKDLHAQHFVDFHPYMYLYLQTCVVQATPHWPCLIGQ